MKSIKSLQTYPKIQIDSLTKTVLNRCKKEKQFKSLQVPLQDNELRVSYYTGLPISEVYNCVQDADHNTTEDCIGNSDHICIMLCLRDMYIQKALPKMENLYKAVCATRSIELRFDSGNYVANYDKFCNDVSLLGYHYRLLESGDAMIIEDPKLTFERYHYLQKLKKICNKNVKRYYLDERVVGKMFCVDKSSLVKADYNKEMFFYAISRYGCENVLVCKQSLIHDYIDWITDILLPGLAPSSIIIINPHHGQSKNKTITEYHSKKDMLTWLRNHNIPCSDDMHKAELYELIDKSSLNSPQSIVENILMANGHTVLILPTSLRNFTPTELLWRDLQEQWQKHTTKDTMVSVKELCGYIDSVSETQWSLYEDTILCQEKLIYNIDIDVDKALEDYNLDSVYTAKLYYSDGFV